MNGTTIPQAADRDGQPCSACGTTRVDGHCPGCRQAARDALAAIDAAAAAPREVGADPYSRLRDGVVGVIRDGVPAEIAAKLYALLDATGGGDA